MPSEGRGHRFESCRARHSLRSFHAKHRISCPFGAFSNFLDPLDQGVGASGQGEAHAQHSLGEMLLSGRGVEPNIAEGIEWIERAASQGHASACADLGRFYDTGKYLEKDPDRARYWWQQAARHGYPQARAIIEALGR
ncbi:tetratricopeptide repeat protein [Sedimenticola sp.]|uniref:tetratricopeptide repeat protein n=1 Tax=Sedimenticola sp. TaxID=1940285 RepID=UPI003D0B820E